MNERGMSTLVVVTLLSVLLLYMAVAGQLVSGRPAQVGNVLGAERALAVAEGGLQVARYNLQQSWSSWSNAAAFPDQAIDSGSYHIAIADDDDGDNNPAVDSNHRVYVTVTGTVGETARTVRALVSSTTGSALSSAAYAGGTITESGDANVSGTVVQGGTAVPGLDTAAAIAQAQANHQNGYATRANGNYFQGDFPGGNQQPTSLNGVMYVDRFANGNLADVHLSNVSTTVTPALLIIVGNVHLSGTVHFNGLLYVTGGGTVDVSVSGSVIITGGIISTGDIILSGSSTLSYSAANVVTATTQSLLTGTGVPQVVSWQEYFP